MNKRASALAAAAAAFFWCQSATAGDGFTGYYAIGLGAARISGPGMQNQSRTAFDASLGAGNDDVALELTVLGFGAFGAYHTTSGLAVNGVALGINALFFKPISEHSSVYLKGGYTAPITSLGESPTAPHGSNNSGVDYGLGLQINVKDNSAFALRLGVDRLPAGVYSDTTKLTSVYLTLVTRLDN